MTELAPSQTATVSLPLGGVLARIQYPLLTLGVLIFVILGWRSRLPVMIVGGDDLTYVSISRSLEAGTYREIYSAAAPRHVKYPPGYPAWLLAVRKLGGDSHDLIKGLNIGLIAIAILSVYVIVRKVAGIGIALIAVFVLAFNPALLRTGATLLSEPLYVAMVGAGLAVATVASPASRRAAYPAIPLAMAAFLTRSAGLTIVLGVGLWLWQRRRRPELIAFGLAALVVVGGWFAYSAVAPPGDAGRSYVFDVAGGFSPQNPGQSRLKPLIQNAVGYATDALPSALMLPTIPGTVVDNVFWLAALIALIGSGIVVLSRAAPAVAWYLVFSVVLLVAWPWRQDRLLIPMVPFVVAALLIGADRLTRRLPTAARLASLGGLVFLAGIGAVPVALSQAAAAESCDRSRPFESAGCYNDESRSMAAASHYLRDTAPGGSVILTVSGAAVNWLTGHLTAEPRVATTFPPGEAGRGLRDRGIRYILITGGRRQEWNQLGPALLASCRDLRLEARFPPAAFVLVTEPPTLPSQDACGDLERLVKTPPATGGG